MSYNIIPIIIIILCLVGIIIIIVRKFSAVATVDTSTISREKEADVKEKIIAERLGRKTKNWFRKISLFLSPFKNWLIKMFNNLRRKISELEKYYQAKQLPSKVEDLESKIKTLLLSAEELLKENKPREAEQKYIEVISLDSKNIEAYRKLGSLYLEEKDYEHAKEVLDHVLKMKPGEADIYMEIGLLYRALGDLEKALENFKQAARLLPNDPRNLDFLIETAILLDNKSLAEEMWQKLKEVNPENQKLKELKEKIKGIG